MEKSRQIQEFNKQNSLYQIIYNYIVSNDIIIFNTSPDSLSKQRIRKFIYNNGIVVNSTKIYDETFKIDDKDIIEIANYNIQFICIKNEQNIDIPIKKEDDNIKIEKNKENNFISDNSKPIIDSDNIEKEISEYLLVEFQIANFDEIVTINHKLVLLRLLDLFKLKTFEEIKSTTIGLKIINYIKDKFINSNLPKELVFDKKKISFSGLIIQTLLEAKNAILNQLTE